MKRDLKRRSIQEIWCNNEQNEMSEAKKKATDIFLRVKQIKTQLKDELQKQHDELHRMKLNMCISIDIQKKKLRKQIQALKIELATEK